MTVVTSRRAVRPLARHDNRRGQVLIVAVLIMLVLAAVAGVFIAVVSSSLLQTARQSEEISANLIAQAGLRFADEQLTFSVEGADWRPPERWPLGRHGGREAPCGNGVFELKVTYQPNDTDPLSKFIKIESWGYLPQDNPFLVRSVVAYKPILLTDYLRFVTNLDRRTVSESLGTPLNINGQDYVAWYRGPIRVNGDLTWYGKNLIDLSADPDYRVEVAGSIAHDVSVPANGVLVQPGGPVQPSVANPFETYGGRYRDGKHELTTGTGTAGEPRWIRPIEPPLIDQRDPVAGYHRYVELTKNSGAWVKDDDSGLWYNTGWTAAAADPTLGVPAADRPWGIYVDNFEDIQFNHNQNDLLADWMHKLPPERTDSAWQAWPEYDPPGVTIDLLPSSMSGPAVRMSRAGGWLDPKNPFNADGSERRVSIGLQMPYPRNGVIYAEGNVKIRGTLPASPATSRADPNRYFSESSRRYDLTVVSGGSIYIEGPLMSQGDDSAGTTSKLALLAADGVCLNTSKVLPHPTSLPPQAYGPVLLADPRGGGGTVSLQAYRLGAGNIMTMEFGGQHVGQPVKLYLRHGAIGAHLPGLETKVDIAVDGTPLTWGGGGQSTYSFNLLRSVTASSSQASNPWYELLPATMAVGQTQVSKDTPVTLDANRAIHDIQFISSGSADYLLYNVAVLPLECRVNALVYAQRGSWFVMPGEWWNPVDSAIDRLHTFDYNYAGLDTSFPRHRKPVDVSLKITGAISENHTAPVGYATSWIEHWRGSDEVWANWGGDAATPPPGLSYQYDRWLRSNLWKDPACNLPRLPKLPASPVLITSV